MPTPMTKQHFQKLAEALHRSRPADHHLQSGLDEAKRMELRAMDTQWQRDVEMVCAACAATNPRFDVDTFVDWVTFGGKSKFKK